MKKNTISLVAMLALALLSWQPMAAKQLTRYVDPFIGTGGHGHT